VVEGYSDLLAIIGIAVLLNPSTMLRMVPLPMLRIGRISTIFFGKPASLSTVTPNPPYPKDGEGDRP
jgi:hypothetical protein